MQKIIYVPKPKTVEEFGSTSKKEFLKWIPEICGVCCFKMVGDSKGKTNKRTLWELTQESVQVGAFRQLPDGKIEGIFYKPLVKLAAKYKMHGKIYRWLPLVLVRLLLRQDHTPILSIDLSRLDKKYEAGHLIVIVGYDKKNKEFIVHDPSSVLDVPGEFIHISQKKLRHSSNRRGMVLT